MGSEMCIRDSWAPGCGKLTRGRQYCTYGTVYGRGKIQTWGPVQSMWGPKVRPKSLLDRALSRGACKGGSRGEPGSGGFSGLAGRFPTGARSVPRREPILKPLSHQMHGLRERENSEYMVLKSYGGGKIQKSIRFSAKSVRIEPFWLKPFWYILV